MIGDSIRELLKREPFAPFVVRLSSGHSRVVANPELVVPMKSEVFIATPNSDRWTLIPYLHVAGVENLPNGPGRRGRGIKRKR